MPKNTTFILVFALIVASLILLERQPTPTGSHSQIPNATVVTTTATAHLAPDFTASGLDGASGLEEVEVITGYRYKGEIVPPGKVPVLDLENVEPIIETWSGWEEDISGMTEWDQLPLNTRKFIERYEKELGYPITMIGTGPDRNDMIFREPMSTRLVRKSLW